MYPNSGFVAHFGSNLSQKGCLVLFVIPEKGHPTLRLRKWPVQRKVKRAGKRLRSTKQPLCDSFSSGNVGKGVFGASRFAFLSRGRLAPKQSKKHLRGTARTTMRTQGMRAGKRRNTNARSERTGTSSGHHHRRPSPSVTAPRNRPSLRAPRDQSAFPHGKPGGWAPARRARIEPASPGT